MKYLFMFATIWFYGSLAAQNERFATNVGYTSKPNDKLIYQLQLKGRMLDSMADQIKNLKQELLSVKQEVFTLKLQLLNDQLRFLTLSHTRAKPPKVPFILSPNDVVFEY